MVGTYNPIGSGPYMWVEGDEVTGAVFEKYDDYWGGAPTIDRVILSYIREESTRIAALLAGDIDLMTDVGFDSVEMLKANPNIEVASGIESRIVIMSINTRKEPLADRRVRQALAYAINYEAISAGLTVGMATPLHARPFLPPFEGTPGHGAFDHIEGYEFNPEKARALLEEAGATGFSIVIDSIQPLVEVSQAIAQMWSDVGINASVRQWEFAMMSATWREENHNRDVYISRFSNMDRFPEYILNQVSEGSAQNRARYVIDSGLNYGANYARMNGAFAQAFRLRMCLRMARQFEKDPWVKSVFMDAYKDPSKYFSCFSRPHSPIKKGETILSLSPFYEDKYLKIATTSDLDDDYWKDSGKSDEERLYDWKDIPIFFLSAWYGNHLTANFQKYKILKERLKSPVKLQVGHWEHNMVDTFAGRVDFGPAANVDVFWKQRLHWFDQTLKGLDRGMFDKPAIQYYLMGGGSGTKNADGRLNHGGTWGYSDSWPPPHVQVVPYYMQGDGTLSPSAPEAINSCSTYTYDPRDPVPTVGGNFMEYSRHDYVSRATWMPDGAAQDQRANSSKPFCKDDLPLSTREDVLVFQTEPLEEDVEVTGELVARLWVSSTALDTDFTVKLIDVYPSSQYYPEGFAMNLHDSIVRMRYRNGRRKADLIEPGKIYEVELSFNSTSNLFKRGHRIRVDISSSNFPRYDVNLNTGGPLGVPGPVRTAENTLYHDKEHPSQVILPVAGNV